MTSNHPDEAFALVWLPQATAPVVAGRIERDGGRLIFNYGRSYLEPSDAIPFYPPELSDGRQHMTMASPLAFNSGTGEFS